MRIWGWGLTMLAAVPWTARAAAQQRPALIADLPFENSGSYGQDKEVFEALELGLPAMLAGTLDRHPGIAVAERGRVSAALSAAGLGPRQRVDAATAAQVAKTLGARYTVTGSFADFYGKFRINARLVDAQSGKILKVVSNDDPKLQDRSQLAAILETVGQRITAAAGLPEAESESPPAIPTDAIADYSRGLLHESRGDRSRALDFYQRAVTAFPQFEAAEAGRRRVGGS
ncbi:MAG: hypothetical protein H0V43_13835 [Gemmatimonadales bacterium]|nr:hypothetical protein [Gemmatimonadales bacterium]